MVLLPEEYGNHSAHELLSLADQGLVAFDHRLLRAILADMPGVVRYADERAEDLVTEIAPDLVQIFCQSPDPGGAKFLAALAGELREELPEDLIEALARTGKPAFEPLLEVYLKHVDDAGDLPTAIAFLKVDDPRAEAIYDAQEEDEAEFLREVAHGAAEVEPYDIYSHYPETAVPQLAGQPLKVRREFLASKDTTHRLAALSTFLDGELPKSVVKELRQVATGDTDAEVRGVAWETLEGEAKEDKALLAEMRERLHNPEIDPQERCGLAVALAQSGDEKFAEAVGLLYADRATRARALQAMWRSFDKEFAKYASESLDDEDADIREQAILVCGYLNLASEAPRLEKLFQNEAHRDTALFAYALAVPSEVTRARMRQLFKTIEKLAGGLSPDDAETLEQALDLRLEMHGLEPAFGDGEDEEEPAAAAPAKADVGRNDPCPCGSGKKYKKCHGQ